MPPAQPFTTCLTHFWSGVNPIRGLVTLCNPDVDTAFHLNLRTKLNIKHIIFLSVQLNVRIWRKSMILHWNIGQWTGHPLSVKWNAEHIYWDLNKYVFWHWTQTSHQRTAASLATNRGSSSTDWAPMSIKILLKQFYCSFCCLIGIGSGIKKAQRFVKLCIYPFYLRVDVCTDQASAVVCE